MPRCRQTIAERFERNTMPIPECGCIVWLSTLTRSGYGQIRLNNGRSVRAHRLAWTAFREPIPEGKYVLHHCDVRACVNPDHLFLGTQSDNMLDMYRRGRRKRAPALGAKWSKGKWEARISINGKTKYIGRFIERTDAHAAYVAALATLNAGAA